MMPYSRKISLFFAAWGELSNALSLAPQEIVDVEGNNSMLSQGGPTFDMIGCYKDDGNRGLDGGHTDRWTSDQVSYCQTKCKNYCYMAIQNGGECFCDDTPQTTGTYAKTGVNECKKENYPNVACESGYYGCGNAWRNSLYTNTALWSTGLCHGKSPGPLSQIPWKLCDANGAATKFYSNLAGNGPDSGGVQEFRVEGIATVGGVTLDLVVRVSSGSTYKSHTQDAKKRTGGAYVSPCSGNKCEDRVEKGPPCYIVIPFEVKTETTFDFMYVKTKTSAVHLQRRFGFTVFELDQERDDWDGAGPDHQYIEYVQEPLAVTAGSHVKETTGKHGRKRIESIDVGDFNDNPSMTAPKVTDEQKARSVEAVYTERGVWQVTIGHTGGNSRFDRNVVISGWIQEQVSQG